MTRLVRAFFGRDSGLESEAYAHIWLANLLLGPFPIVTVDALLQKHFSFVHVLWESSVGAAGPLTIVVSGVSAFETGSAETGARLVVFGLLMFWALRGTARAALKSRYLGVRLSAFLLLPLWWISFILPFFLLTGRG